MTYTGGGPLVAGVQGLILDLTFGQGAVANFLTFDSNPDLHFELSTLGPGVSNTDCAALTDGQSCSVPGSPFILTLVGTTTTVTLAASGIATDTSTAVSDWSGTFTTQITTLTPAEIEATILTPGGSVSSTYSGAFDITITSVPEPASLVLIGGGLIALACLKRRRTRQ